MKATRKEFTMGIFKEWESRVNSIQDENAYQEFWKEYLVKEQKNYEMILESKNPELQGTVAALAEHFGMDQTTFTGFLDGINTSLDEMIDLESLEADTEIKRTIIFDKLFFNMLDAKAEWLYNLKQWDGLLTVDERKEIKKQFNATKTIVKGERINRNDVCPCGSGKKYKKCCMGKEEA